MASTSPVAQEMWFPAGTPAGVGPIKGGDQIKIEFERIGSMTVSVAQSSGGKASIFASA